MRAALAAFILLASAPALAQELGLDLSGDEDAPPEEGLDEGKPDEPKPLDEATVALGDRVKAVQRKHFLKKNRLELAPYVSYSLNDPFQQKVGAGLALTYHLVDSLGLQLHYDRYWLTDSENVRIAQRELQALLLSSDLQWTTGASFVFTPVYGKLTWFNTIVQYDLFLLTGLGAAWSQTSGDPVNDGLHPSVNLGLGQRFSIGQFMAFEFWVKQLLYADRPQDREISEIQKVLTVNAGLSFWIPPTFKYETR